MSRSDGWRRTNTLELRADHVCKKSVCDSRGSYMKVTYGMGKHALRRALVPYEHPPFV
jgi:hypothetical protein